MSRKEISIEERLEEVGESFRLVGMAEALSLVVKVAQQDGITLNGIIRWCVWKCKQVTDEHTRLMERE